MLWRGVGLAVAVVMLAPARLLAATPEPIENEDETTDPEAGRDAEARAEAEHKRKLAIAERQRHARPPPEAPKPRWPGVSLRLGYRQFELTEVVAQDQTLEADVFRVGTLDVYPVSDVMRFGLSLQGGMSGDRDYLGQVGLLLGVQWPNLPVIPFAEVGTHAGIVRRSIWPVDQPMPSDFPTMLLELDAEAGLDIHLGRLIVTVSGGFQRGWFALEHDSRHEISFTHHDSWYFKVGIGY